MASIIYKFATSPDAAGRTVTVKDARTHATVTSGSFSNSADETGVVTYRPTLEEGDYYGEFTVPGVPGLEGEKHPVRTRRVDAVLDVPGSIAAGGGGGGATDGVGAVFFGGSSMVVPLDNTKVYCDFLVSDDPPRAPQRDDLMVIDGGDATTINVVKSGLYTVQLNTPLVLISPAFDGEPASVDLTAKITFEVNGDSEPPIYDYNNRVYWNFADASSLLAVSPKAANLTFDQVLLAGDTIQLGFRVTPGGLGAVTGEMHMDPDLTIVLTYRGTVAEA